MDIAGHNLQSPNLAYDRATEPSQAGGVVVAHACGPVVPQAGNRLRTDPDVVVGAYRRGAAANGVGT